MSKKLRLLELDGLPALKCKRCNEIKLLEEFYTDLKNTVGRQGSCKKCYNKYWKEEVSSYKTPEYIRTNRLKNRYGLTDEQYQEMYDNQLGNCKICDEHFDRLGIDHNHSTGQVRALLCDKCNRGLGCFNDDKNTLVKAVFYLGYYDNKGK